MRSIPLMIDLAGKNITIIGGGTIAERRVSTLLSTGAIIHVISPHVTQTLEKYYHQKKINWLPKQFTTDDLASAFLIIIATNNPEVNQIVRDAAPNDVLINAVDNAESGNVQFPSIVQQGKLTISVSTGGASPSLAKKIKDELEDKYDESYERYVDFLYEARVQIKNSNLSAADKRKLLKQLVADDDYLDPSKQEAWLIDFRKNC